MFALGIRYLNGWAMAAADGAKKERAEWPPHPDRVFMALAAGWFESGEDASEGAALRWLETLGPPALAASDANERRIFKDFGPTVSYVPVNDARLGKPPASDDLGKLKDAGLSLLPEFRSRQPRSFPVAVPHDEVVHLIWSDAEPGEHRDGLATLARKAVSIGHSASLVQMWLSDDPPEANWHPVEGVAEHRMRVFAPGRLDYLTRRCNRRDAIDYADMQSRIKAAKGSDKKMLLEMLKQRFGDRVPVSLRPEPGRWLGYAHATPAAQAAIPGSIFDPRPLVLSLSGKRVGLSAALKLSEALRGAMLSGCPEPIPEWLSGHGADGAATARPHVALIPLPFVGREHADGRVMGVALALPRQLDPQEAARCLEPWLRGDDGLPRTIALFAGQWLECKAQIETRESPPLNLQPETWTRASRTWASVTPVVLDRHFDGADKWEQAADVVKDGCMRIGLPRPREVLLHPISLVEGVPRSNEFPRLARKKDGGRMHHAHAVIVFDEPVRGPVLVGAGRFRGYGLCRPMDREASDE